MIHRKKRILWGVVLLCVLGAGLVGRSLVWGGRLACREIIAPPAGREMLTPGFYLESGYGGPGYQTAFYTVEQGKARAGRGTYSCTYASFYDEGAPDALRAWGKRGDYGQLMYYEKHPDVEVFVFDDWHENCYHVFALDADGLMESDIPYTGVEGLAGSAVTAEGVFLYRSRESTVMITAIDRTSGSVIWEKTGTMPSAHRVFVSPAGTRYFPQQDTRVSIISDNTIPSTKGQDFWRGVSVYDFSTYSYRYIETETLYDTLAADGAGNYLLIDQSPEDGYIHIDQYDPSLTLLARLSLALPDEMAVDTESWRDHFNSFGCTIYDGCLYAFIPRSPGSKVGYAAVFDLASGECVTLTEVEAQNRSGLEDFRFVHWQLYLPGTAFCQP